MKNKKIITKKPSVINKPTASKSGNFSSVVASSNSTFKKNLEIKGLTTTSTLSVKSNSTLNNTLVKTNLTVSGISTLNNTSIKNLTISGTSTFINMNVSGDVSTNGNIYVNSDISMNKHTFVKNLVLQEGIYSFGDIETTTNIKCWSSLTVGGRINNIVMDISNTNKNLVLGLSNNSSCFSDNIFGQLCSTNGISGNNIFGNINTVSGNSNNVFGRNINISGNINALFCNDVTLSGDNNVYIGTLSSNAMTESNTTRINDGVIGGTCYVGGVYQNVTSGGIAIYVESDGKLGILTSSERYKKNILSMTSEKSKLLYNLRIVSFNYNQQKDTDPLEYGLIAEEVELLDKDLICYDLSGVIQSVAYQKLLPFAIKTIQDQKTEITELRNKIDEINEKISLLMTK